MNIAITGGTGNLGAATATELVARGHAVTLLSRSAPAQPIDGTTHRALDLVGATDAQIDAALEGVDVIVDAANAMGKQADDVLVKGSGRLNAAAARVGVKHHVLASIVGIEHFKMAYYRAKVAQEQAVVDGPAPYSIIRMTQFHTLIDWALGSAAKWKLAPRGTLRVQPLDLTDAARAMADAAEAEPTGGRQEVGGPQVLTLSELAAARKAAHPGFGIPLPLPALTGDLRALRDGKLTAPAHAVHDGRTWAEFVSGAPARDHRTALA